ncbi:MAG: hypothetical protein OXQ89_10025, partial [Rhodospirillaceae bacterium]|nr:hypothetical protein [Rhodospirillaceae bacterium]
MSAPPAVRALLFSALAVAALTAAPLTAQGVVAGDLFFRSFPTSRGQAFRMFNQCQPIDFQVSGFSVDVRRQPIADWREWDDDDEALVYDTVDRIRSMARDRLASVGLYKYGELNSLHLEAYVLGGAYFYRLSFVKLVEDPSIFVVVGSGADYGRLIAPADTLLLATNELGLRPNVVPASGYAATWHSLRGDFGDVAELMESLSG